MLTWVAVASVILGQSPGSETDSQRAAQAAERAAAAAEKSASAAERAAAAAERIAQSVSGDAPTVDVKPADTASPPLWTGAVGLALISLTGNASTLTFNGTASATRKWEHWALGLKAFGTYGQSRPPDGSAGQVVALAAGAHVRGDRNVSKTVTAFLQVGGETNHVKSIEFLGFGEAGAGIAWLDRTEGDFQKLLLRTDFGIRYAREYQFQYYPFELNLEDRDVLGPRVGVAFRYALSKEIVLTEDAELIPNLLGPSRFLFNSTTKLSSRLTESVSLNVAFQLMHDSLPAPDKVPTDTALTVGVDVAL